MKLVYFSYPYSDDPLKRTEEIKRIVREILEDHSDWIPLIPHFIFDALYDFPKGYLKEAIMEWRVAVKELEIISRCDILVYSEGLILRSTGMAWEWSFASWLKEHEHPIKIVSYEELLWKRKSMKENREESGKR